jgi:dTDP-4-dehydrorhamnose reductase
MKKVIVLGSTGMLGSTMTQYLKSESLSVVEVNSTGRSVVSQKAYQYDIMKNKTSDLEKLIDNHDYVINCAGITKQKITLNDMNSKINLVKINSIFSLELIQLCEEMRIPLIQVGTDCVFSGNLGSYIESSKYDPIDSYGYSKTMGEGKSDFLQTLRCSFIGKELAGKNGLMEWVLNQEKNSIIEGYKNHFWNGLTTLHVSKLISGIIKNNKFLPGTFHVIPNDSISKLDLVNAIAKIFNRSDLVIKPTNSKISVDRTLSTIKREFNDKVWLDAGYNSPPSINEMLKEYFYWISSNPRISNHE